MKEKYNIIGRTRLRENLLQFSQMPDGRQSVSGIFDVRMTFRQNVRCRIIQESGLRIAALTQAHSLRELERLAGESFVIGKYIQIDIVIYA